MPGDVQLLQGAFGDRYSIERELGRGGMATVYLARDLVHDRVVAIKVLLPDLAMALGPERFRREIEIEQQLDHPNILGILDAGEADGQLYFAMPYVSGESLRARMDREGQLPVDEAVRITAAVARGLQYAHERGIVHRDIKPENILLEGDKVLVADFGIARALSSDQEQKLTQTGMALGTPLYMSPEQSLGDRTLDGRSDVYSLACVLYEMLAGQPPFTAPTAQAVLARHHLDAVPSITVVRPTVSDELEEVTLKALAKSAADRPGTMREFAEMLERLQMAGHTTSMRSVAAPRQTRAEVALARHQRRTKFAAGAGLVVAALVGILAWRFGSGEAASAYSEQDRVAFSRVAVLYFADRTPERQLGYLADGLTETLIEDLGRIPGLNVVSRNGAMAYRESELSRDSVGRALGAGLVIAGSVGTEGSNVRVTVELADARDGAPVGEPWSLVLPADSVTLLRDSIAVELERALRPVIGEQVQLREQRVAAGNDAAWTLVQRVESARKRADALWSSGDSTGARRVLGEADSLAARAAAIDPKWAEPVVRRAEIALQRAGFERQPADKAPWLDVGARHAAAALAMDPRNSAALEWQAALRYERVANGLAADTAEVRRLVDETERDLRRAVQLNPKQATAWVLLSFVNYRRLNVQGARDAAKSAYEADAFLASADQVLNRLFLTSYDLSSPVEARDWCLQGRARFPKHPGFHRCQIALLTMTGVRPTDADIAHAWTLVDTLQTLWPGPHRVAEGSLDRILLAAALGRAGQADSARRVLLAARPDRSVDPRGELRGYEAFARVVIGDTEEALSLLEGYLRDNPEHREGFARLNAWWWQGIKSEPRFARLVNGA